MLARYAGTTFLTTAILVLAACQDAGGPGPQTTAAAPVKAASTRDYAPMGTEGATVVISPEGAVVVTAVNGKPVTRDGTGTVISANPSTVEYRRLLLPPGDHSVSMGELGGGGLVDVSISAREGIYSFAVLEAVSTDGQARALVVLEGGMDGIVAASSAPVLVGRSRAEALAFMAASPEERRKMLAASPPAPANDVEQAKARFAAGRKAFDERRYPEALQAFDAAIQNASDFDSAHVYRGMTLLRLNRPQDALAAFDRAIALGRAARGEKNDWLAWPLYNKGVALMGTGKLAEAKAILDESIGLKSTAGALLARANVTFVQGEALSRDGDQSAAEKYFLNAKADAGAGLTLAPRNRALWRIKSGAHFMLNETDEGCAAARKACELGDCQIVEAYPQCKPGS